MNRLTNIFAQWFKNVSTKYTKIIDAMFVRNIIKTRLSDGHLLEYEDNDKDGTVAYENCTDEKDSIDYAAQELCDLIECDFDEFINQ